MIYIYSDIREKKTRYMLRMMKEWRVRLVIKKSEMKGEGKKETYK